MSALSVKVFETLQAFSSASVLNGLPLAVMVVNDIQDVIFANQAAIDLFGSTIVGQSLSRISSALKSDVIESSPERRIVTASGRAYTATFNKIESPYRIVTLAPEPVPNAMDQTDELTGLLRRSSVELALGRALCDDSFDKPLVAVLCLDLDRFKIVNDTLGHPIGDLLLKKVAERLQSACGKLNLVARIGGDEFIVIQTAVEDQAAAEKLASRIVDLVGRTYIIDGHTIHIGVSVGIALNWNAISPEELIRNADLALYEAKRAGRSRYRLFKKGMETSLSERRELEVELRRALALRQFEVYYQPFFKLSDGQQKVAGFEALIRWNNPARGQIAPLSFIPLAEETGLINQIGEWVLRNACRTAASWPDKLVVAVNVSPTQFRADGLVGIIASALGQSGLDPSRLEIEITEAALLSNTRDVLATLNRLRERGVKISMDDFGTGYSSLSYLQKFPFDKIKIDQSFVQDETVGGDSEAILRAIAGLGKALGMAITAEGVENPQQLGRVTKQMCTHVQGFLTGRPMPEDAIMSFLSPGLSE